MPHPTSGGNDSGIADPEFAFASPDTRFVYVTSRRDASVATFKRGKTGSKLTFQRCLSGSQIVGPTGTQACANIPHATSDGTGSGLSRLYAMAMSANGRALYSVSATDAAVDTFKRSPKTGKIRFAGCLTGDSDIGPGGSGACRAIGSAATGGGFSGLSGASSIAMHGRRVVVAASNDSAVASFSSSKKGRLSFRGCLTSDSAVGPMGSGACKMPPGTGVASGLGEGTYIVMSPHGEDAYVAGAEDDAIGRVSP
jgi:hypothetical protein